MNYYDIMIMKMREGGLRFFFLTKQTSLYSGVDIGFKKWTFMVFY